MQTETVRVQLDSLAVGDTFVAVNGDVFVVCNLSPALSDRGLVLASGDVIVVRLASGEPGVVNSGEYVFKVPYKAVVG